jgi:hypothetical protein
MLSFAERHGVNVVGETSSTMVGHLTRDLGRQAHLDSELNRDRTGCFQHCVGKQERYRDA